MARFKRLTESRAAMDVLQGRGSDYWESRPEPEREAGS